MLKREKLNKLVIITLNDNEIKANVLYDVLMFKEPRIMREEHVKSFKSFVKIINSFHDVKAKGERVKTYMRRLE